MTERTPAEMERRYFWSLLISLWISPVLWVFVGCLIGLQLISGWRTSDMLTIEKLIEASKCPCVGGMHNHQEVHISREKTAGDYVSEILENERKGNGRPIDKNVQRTPGNAGRD